MNDDLFARLRDAGGYVYVATPYSKYPAGLTAAWQEACKAAGVLIRAGVPCFSPIAHTHPIATHGDIDPYAHDIWLPADAPMMEAANALLVVKMDTWEESYGIGVEIAAFKAAGKPVEFMEWPA